MDVDLNTTEWPLIEPKLRENKARLQKLDAEMRANPAVARAIGKKLIQAWTTHTKYVAEYNRLRMLIGFQPVIGLGVGIVVSLAIAAGIGVLALGVITYGPQVLDILEKWANAAVSEQQVEQQVAQNRNELIAEARREAWLAVEADKRGDVQAQQEHERRSQELFKQAGTPGAVADGSGQGPFEFLRDNWVWLALAAGAFVVGPRIVDAISDR